MVEICEYPDSNKVGSYADSPGSAGLRKMFHADPTVDYDDRERTVPPDGAA